MKPVKLSELIESLEFESEEHLTRVDLENGCVVNVEQSVLTAVEEGDEEALRELAEWQKGEVENAFGETPKAAVETAALHNPYEGSARVNPPALARGS